MADDRQTDATLP